MLQKKRRSLWLALMVLILLLAGCGEKKAALTDGREVYVKEDKTEKPEESDEPKEVSAISEETLFLVTKIDTKGKQITLKSYKDEEENEYSYTGGTNIQDKYGSSITMEQLKAGEMVRVKLKKEKVTSIQVSDEVFTYGDIHNFVLNTEEKSITVGKTSYYYEDDIQVFYHNSKISMAEISEQDTICLKGIDKKVYAIQVTSGHGTVVLQNTSLFEGGYITIGNLMSLEIVKDMKIEVTEGEYLLSVVKDGYGGTGEITVEANREVTVNLEELKGEEPKYCTIAFKIEPEDATLYLNGEAVDLSQSMQLRYGTYSLSAKAEGYADWKRTLIVNSKKANLKIELQTEKEAEEEEKEKEEEKEAEVQSSKEEEEAVKKAIQEIRNRTLSTSDTSNGTGTTSGTN